MNVIDKKITIPITPPTGSFCHGYELKDTCTNLLKPPNDTTEPGVISCINSL